MKNHSQSYDFVIVSAGTAGRVLRGCRVRLGTNAAPHPLSQVALEAARQVGHRVVDDIDSGVEEGFGWAEFTRSLTASD
ncbi:hypothetical protein GCM10010464_19820 [Pseudonocardia yunnanensis]